MNAPRPHPHPDNDAPDDRLQRRRSAALAGHTGDLDTARRLLGDPDASVRATALGAVVRTGGLDADTCDVVARDPDPGVRRRLAEELGRHRPPALSDPRALAALVHLLADPDPLTTEAAAWALGEVASPAADEPHGAGQHPTASTPVVEALIGAANHDDALVREAAIAALGAIGDPAGLPTVLAGTTDRPAIRRRAVLALAPFLGEAGVDEALERASTDRDWQVRQAAELLRPPDP